MQLWYLEQIRSRQSHSLSSRTRSFESKQDYKETNCDDSWADPLGSIDRQSTRINFSTNYFEINLEFDLFLYFTLLCVLFLFDDPNFCT